MHVISPVPRDVWEDVFRADPDATPFQGPRWIDGLCRTGRFTDESRLYVTPVARIVLPLVGYRIGSFVHAAASLPRGYGAGGMLSDASVDTADIFDDLSRARFHRVSLRPNPLLGRHDTSWRSVPRTAHVLSLAGGLDGVLARMQARKRTAIRRAQRAGFTVERGNNGHFVDRYYDVYLRWCDHKARPHRVPARVARWVGRRLEPHAKFLHMAEAMGDALCIYIASAGGAAVAASILVHAHAAAAYWRGASDLALPAAAGASDVLQLAMIEDACAAGCRSYHMGHSGRSRGLADYKERLGARRHDYAEYIFERPALARVSRVLTRQRAS